jgi:hypothetical protein
MRVGTGRGCNGARACGEGDQRAKPGGVRPLAARGPAGSGRRSVQVGVGAAAARAGSGRGVRRGFWGAFEGVESLRPGEKAAHSKMGVDVWTDAAGADRGAGAGCGRRGALPEGGKKESPLGGGVQAVAKKPAGAGQGGSAGSDARAACRPDAMARGVTGWGRLIAGSKEGAGVAPGRTPRVPGCVALCCAGPCRCWTRGRSTLGRPRALGQHAASGLGRRRSAGPGGGGGCFLSAGVRRLASPSAGRGSAPV